MNIILLSGGSGKRLWPLSNEIRSKQFIRMFQNAEGELESMVQRVYRQIVTVDPEARITIATSKKQASAIKNQLNDKVKICVEPDRRDTFPAICLAAAYLHDVLGCGIQEPVVVCPVDPYVDNDYFVALQELSELAADGSAALSLLGMEPTYPSEKYGYIIPRDKDRFSRVEAFKEKPDMQTAEEYIARGALWNGGVFAFRMEYLLNKSVELLGTCDYQVLFDGYEKLSKISFDYAVAEKETDIKVLRFSGGWMDIGTWITFAEAMEAADIGRVIRNDTCENTHVVNELNIPVICMGCKDMIISASSDGILVSEKEQSSYIKPYVDQIEQQVMYAEKSWGSFTVLDVQKDSMTIKIVLLPGNKLHYHSHTMRDEVWTVMSGRGKAIVDEVVRPVGPGDVVSMPAGTKHTIIAEIELKVIEVQLGDDITVDDKVKYKRREV